MCFSGPDLFHKSPRKVRRAVRSLGKHGVLRVSVLFVERLLGWLRSPERTLSSGDDGSHPENRKLPAVLDVRNVNVGSY